jgi:hypothetical protein
VVLCKHTDMFQQSIGNRFIRKFGIDLRYGHMSCSCCEGVESDMWSIVSTLTCFRSPSETVLYGISVLMYVMVTCHVRVAKGSKVTCGLL